ncbi:winged helix DNA-binding domain-containing protein, partial [Trametes versicolor FP-101664 SS1]|uniref:winged helix DNA-binding domain-containing protein n=1 Tax=Trametes versicolor (strain FP-101664) TaxID=717944 RepID=UPI000462493A
SYAMPVLIILAIHGSPDRRLTLLEIYSAFEDRFEWYRQNTQKLQWKNSIRHNLSLYRCFRRMSKPVGDPRKGSFWVVD